MQARRENTSQDLAWARSREVVAGQIQGIAETEMRLDPASWPEP